MANPYLKQYLMTAGPTPLPPAVSQARAEPMLYHRAPAFVEVYARALDRLKVVFGTANEVQVFAASGTGAMESAVANLTRHAEPALVASCGNFGERWAKLCDAYGAETIHWATDWGRKVDPAELDRKIGEHKGLNVVFTTLSETSTGVVNDIRELTEVAHRHGALIAVDAISGIGAVPLPQDEWGVDVVVAGSQKALMAPPGLGMVSVSPAALAARGSSPRYYFDWERTQKAQRKLDAPFTPAVTLVRALDVALGLILEEGLQDAFDRHVRLGRACREGIKAMGLELASPDEDRSAVVTTVRAPEELDVKSFLLDLRDRLGVQLIGGQGEWAGKVFRIGHIGYFDLFDITTALAAVEDGFVHAGIPVDRGVAVSAALNAFEHARA
jgi:aspartate aminotransferase-like enzyme